MRDFKPRRFLRSCAAGTRGSFKSGQLRTLQRRFRRWRALKGDEREVYFAQAHRPGEQSQSDFTDMKSLEVMIDGERFPHLLYHFVLTYSNWESVMVCGSETFESLSEVDKRVLEWDGPASDMPTKDTP